MYIHSEKDYIPKSADRLISQICPDESAKAVLEQFDEPEPIVTHLLDLFWTYQASCLNVVNRNTFCRHRKLYEQDPASNQVSCYSPCLLYAILALASMISQDKGVRKYSTGTGGTPGETFYRKAKVLLELELSRPTATTVQAAVLVGSWFGATGHYSLGWTWSGVAFRMAFEVGLHEDCSRAVANGLLDADAAENRTKAFWCCYVQDKFWSSHTGRPCFFMDWDITLDVPGADAEAVEKMSQRDRCTTLSERNIIFLAILMSKTLLALYRQRHTSTMEELCKCASSIHKELIQWHRDLPAILSWPRAEGDAPPSPHIFVMHMQFYFTLILLHRPFLAYAKTEQALAHADSQVMDATTACTLAATNMAKLVRDYQAHYSLKQIGAPAIQMTFIAATIHLVNFHLTKKEMHKLLFCGCTVSLVEMGEAYPLAFRAVDVLKDLEKRWILQSSDQGQENTNGEQRGQDQSATAPIRPNTDATNTGSYSHASCDKAWGSSGLLANPSGTPQQPPVQLFDDDWEHEAENFDWSLYPSPIEFPSASENMLANVQPTDFQDMLQGGGSSSTFNDPNAWYKFGSGLNVNWDTGVDGGFDGQGRNQVLFDTFYGTALGLNG